MFLFNKLINKKYLTKKILGSEQTYIKLHNKYKNNKSLITKEIENKTGFNLNNIFFEELAFHTQVVIKKSDLNYQHGKILYSILRIVTSEAFQENSESYFDEKSTKQQEIYKDSQGNPFIDSEGNPVQQKWIDKHLGKIGFLIILIVIWSLWFIA